MTDERECEGDPARGSARPATAYLVHSIPDTADGTRHCADLLAPRGVETVDLLHVSFAGAPTVDRDYIEDRGVEIGRSALVLVGTGTGDVAVDRTFSVDAVETTDHLSELGMSVRGVLDEWSTDGTHSVLCFDSVTDLVARADFELTFEFLLVLVEGIRQWDVTAHFHLDPAAADEQERRTLAQLFDDVIEPTDRPA